MVLKIMGIHEYWAKFGNLVFFDPYWGEKNCEKQY